MRYLKILKNQYYYEYIHLVEYLDRQYSTLATPKNGIASSFVGSIGLSKEYAQYYGYLDRGIVLDLTGKHRLAAEAYQKAIKESDSLLWHFRKQLTEVNLLLEACELAIHLMEKNQFDSEVLKAGKMAYYTCLKCVFFTNVTFDYIRLLRIHSKTIKNSISVQERLWWAKKGLALGEKLFQESHLENFVLFCFWFQKIIDNQHILV